IEDKRIYYNNKKSGSNKAIIFVHGSGGSSYTWKNQLNLDIDYDLITLDLPSHDKSDNFSDLSLHLYVDVVHQLIKSLNYENIILCGHSLGGAIVQQYYFIYPKDVSGLILFNTGGKLRVAPFILKSLKNNYQEFMDSLPADAFYRATPKKTIELYIQETSKISADVTYNDFKICDGFDVLSKLSTIEVPCLIIVGKQDQLTPVKYSVFFHNNIKKSELHIISKAGHMVMLEKPNEVNQAIENFINNHF
ncbi:MAG: alpha/beta fold hydrolase, partial [Promethearchaeota archaeon]